MDISYITIKTLAPVVLTAPGSSQILTESSSQVNGTILRGILAGEYIKKHNLGKKAHEDAGFISYFFDQLRFLAANPAVQGKRSYVLPLSLMKAKQSDAPKPITDLLWDKPAAGYKKLSGLASVENGKIYPASVRRSMTFHMSRNSVSERLGGHSQDGRVYTYEAIDAGQTFIGAVIGDRQVLQAFFADTGNKGESFTCRIGRSKRTAYGKCQLTFAPPQPLSLPALGEKVILRLDSPLLPFADNANQATQVLEQEICQKLNQQGDRHDFSLGQVFSAAQSVENFVRIWGLRRPCRMGLAAGTVFELKKESPWSEKDQQALFKLMYQGAGLLTEEGFGQLRLWQQQNVSLAKEESPKVKKVPLISAEVKNRTALILRQALREKLRNFAYEDALHLTGLDQGSKTHVFARLESWLGPRQENGKDAKKTFFVSRQQKLTAGSPMENNLRHILLNGTALYEILAADYKGNMPYAATARLQELHGLLPDKLLQEIGFQFTDEDCFYDYWLWLFRYGRKQAVQANKGKENAENAE